MVDIDYNDVRILFIGLLLTKILPKTMHQWPVVDDTVVDDILNDLLFCNHVIVHTLLCTYGRTYLVNTYIDDSIHCLIINNRQQITCTSCTHHKHHDKTHNVICFSFCDGFLVKLQFQSFCRPKF